MASERRPRRRSRPLTDEEQQELQAHWDDVLAAEGLPPEPHHPLKRATKPNSDGKREWLGAWEFPSPIGNGSTTETYDVTVTPRPPAGSERPDSPMEALLRAEPHDPIATSRQELHELRDLVLDAIDALEDRIERYVILKHVVEGRSLGKVAAALGVSKTYAWNRKQTAIWRLQDALVGHQAVAEYLTRHDIPDEEGPSEDE